MGTESDITILDKDGQQIAVEGWAPVGNGERKSYADLTPEERDQYQAKALETRRRNAEVRKLAQLQSYLEAHQEKGALLFGAKLAIIEGLLEEMTHPAGHKRAGQLDTRLLDEKRLKVLQSAITEFERSGGMRASGKGEAQKLDVNVTHTVSKLVEALQPGSKS